MKRSVSTLPETNHIVQSSESTKLLQRYFIQLSYDGTNYHGWQIQENTTHTVQQVLNNTLSKVLNEPIFVTGCGRTDTGVHATEFYAHFDSSQSKLCENPERWVVKLNGILPQDIALQNIIPVSTEANSRFDAVSRTYKYIVSKKKNPFLVNKAFYYHGQLDIDAMNLAATLLFDYTDFSSFARSNTQTFTNNCIIYKAEWVEDDDTLTFTVSANRFLRNMVRALVGTLLEVGKGKITIDDFKKIIESKNRSNAGLSVLACGLYLISVEYPESVLLNQQTIKQ